MLSVFRNKFNKFNHFSTGFTAILVMKSLFCMGTHLTTLCKDMHNKFANISEFVINVIT